jgi:signal transduction histidine kinase
MVAGLSAMLQPGSSYDRFHLLLAASLSKAVSNAAAYEHERRRAEIDRAKTTFFSNVSHEFRTPLTLMLTPIQDMLAAPDGARVEHEAVQLLHRKRPPPSEARQHTSRVFADRGGSRRGGLRAAGARVFHLGHRE